MAKKKIDKSVVPAERSEASFRDELVMARSAAAQALGAYRLVAFDKEVLDRSLNHVLNGYADYCEKCKIIDQCDKKDAGLGHAYYCREALISYMEEEVRAEAAEEANQDCEVGVPECDFEESDA